MANNGLIEWRDISTAPKDGSPVLLLAGAIIEGYWWGDNWSQCVVQGQFFFEQPTHWAPLPWKTFE